MKVVAAIKLLLLAIVAVFVIVACSGNNVAQKSDRILGSSASLAECRTVQHAIGKTQICNQPQRIVALGPKALELLLSLDLQPAGFADYFQVYQDVYDDPARQIPYLGSRVIKGTANVGFTFSPSIEAVLKVKPDLIIGTEFNTSQYEVLSQIAPTLLLKWVDTKDSLEAITKAIGRPEQAKQLLGQIEQRLATARKEFSPIVATYPQLLILNSNSQMTQNLPMNSSNSFCGSLLADLGFKLVSAPGADQSQIGAQAPISIEILPQLDTDHIILLGTNDQINELTDINNFEKGQVNTLKQHWQKNAIAQSLQASKEGRVYFIPAYLCLGLPGPLGTELFLKELQSQMAEAVVAHR